MQCHQAPLCWAAQDRWLCIKCLALPKHTCSAASVSRDTHRGRNLQRLTAHGTEPAKTSQELCHQPRPVPCWSRSWCCWPAPKQQRGADRAEPGLPEHPHPGTDTALLSQRAWGTQTPPSTATETAASCRHKDCLSPSLRLWRWPRDDTAGGASDLTAN